MRDPLYLFKEKPKALREIKGQSRIPMESNYKRDIFTGTKVV
jgi:hypothetical protein